MTTIKERVLGKLDGTKKIRDLYNLKRHPFSDMTSPSYSEKINRMIVKDGLPMGCYTIMPRPPEHSTFKWDLTMTAPEQDNKVHQVRVELTKQSLSKIINEIIQEERAKAIDLTLSEVGGMVGMEIERFDSKAGCDIIVAVLKDLKQKLENGK